MDECFVRVPLDNICFTDVIEQAKFERLKNNASYKAITQIEALLKDKKIEISLE